MILAAFVDLRHSDSMDAALCYWIRPFWRYPVFTHTRSHIKKVKEGKRQGGQTHTMLSFRML